MKEWLAMDMPNDLQSEDDYDLDENQTDEQAPQQVDPIDRLLFPICQDIEDTNINLQPVENNSEMPVFDFSELNDTINNNWNNIIAEPSNTNNLSFLRVLRPRASAPSDEVNIHNEVIPPLILLPQKSQTQNLEYKINIQWRKRDQISDELPLYKESKGHNEDMLRNCKSATDIFVKLLNPIVDHIKDQSNLYATQNNKNLKLIENELLAFIGINFCMGLS